MPEQKASHSRFWGMALLVVVCLLAWYMKPATLKFEENIARELPTMFGYLVLISLFVERAIEVFLSAWRSAGADELDGAIAGINKQLKGGTGTAEARQPGAAPDGARIEDLMKKLDGLEMERTRYRADSRYRAQWLGLAIGVLTALAGVRVLGNIVDISGLSGGQVVLFIIVDILLTGAVLAGGSDAINKIMKVYNSFMTATAEKAKS